jgi:amidase
MRRLASCLILLIAPALAAAGHAQCGRNIRVGPLDLATVTLLELSQALEQRLVSSEQLVKAYLRRIARCDGDTRAILSLNPQALTDARRLDAERRKAGVRGPLHGVPIVIKDNIDVAGLVTSAGSLALERNLRERDAPLVQQLRAAGAIVIAKTNLSEWANFRSRQSSSGWSAVGGLTRNARDPLRSACGSSSGSAVAVAAHFAPGAVGTETNGSIVCPASVNGIVGLKPTVGRISREGIVPISHSQDTAGPMTSTVADAALLLQVLADPSHPLSNYRAVLDGATLQGKRLGVARFIKGFSPGTEQSFNAALDVFRAQGAILVEIESFDFGDLRELQLPILLTEFKAGLNAYLAATPPAVRVRTLADLIAFNRAEPRELEWFGQDLFEQSQATPGLQDEAYLQALRKARLQGGGGLERLMRENDVLALLAPTTGPAWSIDLINGDRSVGSASLLPAISGQPHLTMPMRPVAGMPVGLSIFGPAWSEELLLSVGHAFERAQAHSR